jgi:hypothetical protein
MESMYYIGLDVHKKTISYCVKDASGPRASWITSLEDSCRKRGPVAVFVGKTRHCSE